MTDRKHAPEVLAMMAGLYAEDEAASPVDAAKFPRTIEMLLEMPQAGRVVLMLVDQRVCGYALVIPYWSNEYGGMIAFIDEVFVMRDSRGRGLTRGLFAMIETQRPFDAVAMILEVSPTNLKARGLYESMGMRERHNSLLAKRLVPPFE
jgi:GNAT superfamily N-acetyltransferase